MSRGSADGYGLTVNPTIHNSLPSKYQSGGINAGVYNDEPPDEFVQNHELVGWTVDLAKELSTVLGIKFKYSSTAFDPILPAIQNGRFDLGIGSFAPRPERLKTYDMIPTLTAGESFASSESSGLIVNTLTDLCGHSAAVQSGSYDLKYMTDLSEKCVAQGKKAIKVSQMQSMSQGALAVSSGRFDVLVGGIPTLSYLAKQAHGLKVNSLVASPVFITMVARKGDPLSSALAAGMQELIEKGVYQKILAKWDITVGLLRKGTVLTESNPNGT